MFINAQLPFSLSDGSGFCVNLQSISTAPDSSMGALAGENSNKRLHTVEVQTASISGDEGSLFSSSISGHQTKWSYKKKSKGVSKASP